MHAIDEELVRRIHSAWRRAAATSRGLMGEIITGEQAVNRAAARVREVEMRASIFPDTERPEPGEDWEDYQYRRNQADQRRANAEGTMRRTLRSIGQADAVATYAADLGRPTEADFALELAEAQAGLERAEAHVAGLRQEQGILGSRAGMLRQTLQQSADWLRANGYARLAGEIAP